MASHNHQHNMLTNCKLLPPQSSIRHLLHYLYIMLAFMSYLTDTFGIESMAAANGSLEEAAKTEKVWRTCE